MYWLLDKKIIPLKRWLKKGILIMKKTTELINHISNLNDYLNKYLKDFEAQNGHEDYLLSELKELSDMQTAIIKELQNYKTDNSQNKTVKHLLEELRDFNGSCGTLRTRDNKTGKYRATTIEELQDCNYDLITELAKALHIKLY